MFSLVSLILMLFSILATILMIVVTGLVIIILLVLFLVVAIVIGASKQSIFKGLKFFVLACAALIITPATSILFANYFGDAIHISSNNLYIVGIILGLIISVLFGIFTSKLFEKIAKYAYQKIKKEKA